LIKRTIHQEERSILSIYVPNIGHPTTLKNTNGLKDTDRPNTVIVGDLNTLLSQIDRSSWQKINKETSELIDMFDQMDIKDTYSVFLPTTNHHAVQILFSSSWKFLQSRSYFRTQCKSQQI
jgi:hypothetical protein